MNYSMPGEMPPPIELYNEPSIQREAPETPKPILDDGVVTIPDSLIRDSVHDISQHPTFLGVAKEAREHRAEQEAAFLEKKAAFIILDYVEKNGLFPDLEPNDILKKIQGSELFRNEIQYILETATEAETGLEQNPTSVSPLSDMQKTKSGEEVEIVHGLYIAPATTLLTDPETKKGWKPSYLYNFRDRDTWQRIFPGTEPTQEAQAAAEKILDEAQLITLDLQNEYKKTGSYYELTPERAEKIDILLSDMNIDPDEVGREIEKDVLEAYTLLHETADPNDVSNVPPLVNGDMIREIALRTVASGKTDANGLQKSLEDLKDAVKIVPQFTDFIRTVPMEKRGTPDFYLDLKEHVGDDAFKQFLIVKEAGVRGSVDTQKIEEQMADFQSREQARREYQDLQEQIEDGTFEE